MIINVLTLFPEMFTPDGYYSVRSIVENRCILTMQEGLLQLSAMQQPLIARSKASQNEKAFLDPEDKQLTDQRLDSLTMARYERFRLLNSDDGRLMGALFNDQNYVISYLDADALSKKLFILASDVQHTNIAGIVTLYDITMSTTAAVPSTAAIRLTCSAPCCVT